jgi:hypothetical protein
MNVVKPEICCQRLGDATQTIGVLIVRYPLKNDLSVDVDMVNAFQGLDFFIWKISSKKFHQIEDAYRSARTVDRHIIDLIVTLDGDPKYQKQSITACENAMWEGDNINIETQNWILNLGLRLWKHAAPAIGVEIELDKLHEKFGLPSGSHMGGHTEIQRIVSNYDDFLDGGSVKKEPPKEGWARVGEVLTIILGCLGCLGFLALFITMCGFIVSNILPSSLTTAKPLMISPLVLIIIVIYMGSIGNSKK